MFFKEDKASLEREYEFVLNEIDKHPANSYETKAAQDIIERMKSEGKTTREIDDELFRNDLPSLAEGGIDVFKNLRSLTKLHNRKKKLEKKLEKTQGLENRYQLVLLKVEDHEFTAQQLDEARNLVYEKKKQGYTITEIDKELSLNNLPSLAQLGLLTAKIGGFSALNSK